MECNKNSDKFRWKTLRTRLMGTFSLKQVQLPTGKCLDYLLVSYPEAAGVLALTDDQQVVMVGQYRYAVDEYCWEIPAGSREKGESVVKCAKRELQEETGYSARHIKPFFTFHPSNAASDHTVHLCLATNLTKSKLSTSHKEPVEELIRVKLLPFDIVLNQVLQGEIRDACTVIAVLHYAHKLQDNR